MLRRQVFKAASSSLMLCALAVSASAQESSWRVARLSGEAWVTRAGAPASPLTTDAVVGNGEKIQTSRTGRVQLVRGAETVLVAPNSVLELSKENDSRTIVRQQSGSVTIEAEKKHVQHFEVRTPILAAIVKGTEFTVTLRGRKADVVVTRGQVDVTSFRSGQSVLVLPGQRASTTAVGRGTLAITGAGRMQAIRNGAPVTTDVKPLPVPRGGFTSPLMTPTAETPARRAEAIGTVRISSPIGAPVNLHKATKGLSSAPGAPAGDGRRAAAGRENISLWKQQVEAESSGASSTSAQGALLGPRSASAGVATGDAGASGAGNGGSAGSPGGGNAVSAAATAAAGSGGAAVSAAVRAANRKK